MGPKLTKGELDLLRARGLAAARTLAPVVAVAAAAVAWTLRPSPALALVGALTAGSLARGLTAALARTDRTRQVAYHLSFPTLLVAAMAVSSAMWGIGWLAAGVAIATAWGAAEMARRERFPDLFLEDEALRRRELDELRPIGS